MYDFSTATNSKFCVKLLLFTHLQRLRGRNVATMHIHRKTKMNMILNFDKLYNEVTLEVLTKIWLNLTQISKFNRLCVGDMGVVIRPHKDSFILKF